MTVPLYLYYTKSFYEVLLRFSSCCHETVSHLEKQLHEHTITFFVLELGTQPAPYLESNRSNMRRFSVVIGGYTCVIIRGIKLSTLRTNLSG